MPDSSALSSYWDTPREDVASRREATPIPNDLTAVVYTERFHQAVSAYARPARGTQHATKTGYWIVRDDELELREGLKTFDRVWANIPATRDEPLETSYTYPGYLDERDPITLDVAGRVLLEYFLHVKPAYRRILGATCTAATDVIAASGHPFVDGEVITFVSGTNFTGLTAGGSYYVRDAVIGVSFKVADTLGGAAKDLTAAGTAGIFYRGIPPNEGQRYTNTYGDVMVLNDGGAGVLATTPTRADYKALVSSGGEINATSSRIEQYLGDIWCRKTPKIPAR